MKAFFDNKKKKQSEVSFVLFLFYKEEGVYKSFAFF